MELLNWFQGQHNKYLQLTITDPDTGDVLVNILPDELKMKQQLEDCAFAEAVPCLEYVTYNPYHPDSETTVTWYSKDGLTFTYDGSDPVSSYEFNKAFGQDAQKVIKQFIARAKGEQDTISSVRVSCRTCGN